MILGGREVLIGIATDQGYCSGIPSAGAAQDQSRVPNESAVRDGVIAADAENALLFRLAREFGCVVQEQQPCDRVAVVRRWPEDASSNVGLKIALLDGNHPVVTQPEAARVSGHLVVRAVRQRNRTISKLRVVLVL
jgi:hypothetical protein